MTTSAPRPDSSAHGPPTHRPTIVAVALVAAAVAWVRARGFAGVSNDDAARALIAWDFARHPSADPTRSSWLPAHSWELGALLRAVPDLDLTPRALSFAAACACVAAASRGARDLGASPWGALGALALACGWRWTALSSAAGAVPEMPCVAWLIASVAWLPSPDDARPATRYAAAGLMLAVACGHRYEAWFAGAGLVAWELASTRGRRGAWALACAAALMPLAWLWINHARGGGALDFVRRVEAFRRAEGLLPGVWARVARYPWLAARELAASAALALVGLRVLWRDGRRDALRWAVPAASTLAMLVLGDLRGGGPTHHAARALVGVAWLLVPLAAVGLDALAKRARTAAALVVIAGVAWGWPRDADWRGGVAPDAVCAGDAVRDALARRDGARWFVELARQDFLWVEARSGAPERATPDRAYGAAAPAPEALRALAAGTTVAAASGAGAVDALRRAGLRVTRRCGAWSVLRAP